MNYCYSPMDCPTFFPIDGDCESVNHDLVVREGDLTEDEVRTISAVLIQLNTNLRSSDALSLDERGGWWGDQFLPFPMGTRLWTLSGQQNVAGVTVQADEMIRSALGPLIDQGMFDDIRVRSVKVMDGIDSEVTLLKGGQTLLTTVL